ncbi:type II secretion system protein GspM [Sphingomicrobium sp. XHP0239]|uniref:type II secretion system protein GspM n=1 Tax=Sphingomicrobium maritimum TaxID=3133972 RepID=UPI0031CC61FA
MNAIRDWWRGRSRREQILFGILALVAVPVIAWFLIIAPAVSWHDEARETYVASSDRYGRVKALAEAMGGDPSTTATAPMRIDASLDQFVATSADQAGFALTSNSASGPDRTNVSIAQARSAAALAWLEQLRAAGVVVEAMSMTDNGEGGVALDLTLAKAAS